MKSLKTYISFYITMKVGPTLLSLYHHRLHLVPWWKWLL